MRSPLRGRLSGVNLNLDTTLSCGQALNWKKSGNYWYGVIRGYAIRLAQNGREISVESSPKLVDTCLLENYFRLDDDLEVIQKTLSHDRILRHAMSCLPGLRLLRQDPWECTMTYICATNSSIPAISRMVDTLSKRFGNTLLLNSHELYTFPGVEVLAKSRVPDLRQCGLGYRASFIKATARRVAERPYLWSLLHQKNYHDGKEILIGKNEGKKTYLGIGNKVADCILLFSLDKMESFPVDIWIARAIYDNYLDLLDKVTRDRLDQLMRNDGSLGPNLYEKISACMRDYFGQFAGYAQEYLYAYTRQGLARRLR